MASPISYFYRLWLPTIDPLCALIGVVSNLIAQSTILNSYNAGFPNNPRAVPIEAAVCLETIAGHLLATLFLQVVLLRARPNDLTVWRCVQFSILIVDLFMLGAIGKALNAQGRLGWRDWRTEEWTFIGVTSTVAVLRVAFLAGIGVGEDVKMRKA